MTGPLRRLAFRCWTFLRPGAAERELTREVASHLDAIADDLQSRGLDPRRASVAASRAFGGVEQAKERQRDERSFRLLEDFRRDARHAVSALLRRPGFAAVAIITIAVGVGANSAIFSLVNAVLLRPLPVVAPEQLALLTLATVGQRSDDWFSYPLYAQMRDRTSSFSGVASGGSITNIRVTYPNGEIDDAIRAERISGSYFPLLGITASVGRVLRDDDDRSDATPAIVLGHAYWTRRFGGDPAVVGGTVTISNVPFTIVGVAPRGFHGVVVGEQPDVWWPMAMLGRTSPANRSLTEPRATWLHIVGRLKPGVTLTMADTEAKLIYAQHLVDLEQRSAAEGDPWSASERASTQAGQLVVADGRAGTTPLRSRFARPLATLTAIAALVLILACANVANLLLARATTRAAEMASRLAIGASRRRLMRQLLTESLVLGGFGGVAGIIVATIGARLLIRYFPQSGAALDVSLDGRLLAFSTLITVAAVALFGLAPAFAGAGASIASILHGHGRGSNDGPWQLALRRGLVAMQIAVMVVLLAGAGLFIRTLRNLQSLDAGFAREHVTTLLVSAGQTPSVDRPRVFARVQDELAMLPGARAASFFTSGLLSGEVWAVRPEIPGYVPQEGETMRVIAQEAGPRFFDALGIPLVSGRDLTDADRIGSERAAVVNQTMARRYFTNDAIGREFSILGPGASRERVRIVGVARDTKYQTLREPPQPSFTVAASERLERATFAVRTAGTARDLANEARAVIRRVDARLQVTRIRTVEQVREAAMAQELFIAWIAAIFGALALLLASVGLYGVLSYHVAARSKALAIRCALGAQRRALWWTVYRDELLLVALGLAIGLPLAFLSARVIEGQLFGVGSTDPLTITMVLVTIGATALAAGYLPARRAGRSDPMMALRAE